MGESRRVIFRRKRIADGDWQIDAHCPGGVVEYITGFTTDASIDEWLDGSRCIEWLKARNYTK
jgi:hypothetical protein